MTDLHAAFKEPGDPVPCHYLINGYPMEVAKKMAQELADVRQQTHYIKTVHGDIIPIEPNPTSPHRRTVPYGPHDYSD